MEWIEQEAVCSGITHGRQLKPRPGPELAELAASYGVKVKTIRQWAKELRQGS